jgi:hypothetical protein
VEKLEKPRIPCAESFVALARDAALDAFAKNNREFTGKPQKIYKKPTKSWVPRLTKFNFC